MDILEAGEKCKVIIVRENSDEIIAVSLPYDEKVLLKLLRDSIKPYNSKMNEVCVEQLTGKYPEYVFVRKEYGHKKVAVRDITYLEADRNYCQIHLSGGQCLNVSIPIIYYFYH